MAKEKTMYGINVLVHEDWIDRAEKEELNSVALTDYRSQIVHSPFIFI